MKNFKKELLGVAELYLTIGIIKVQDKERENTFQELIRRTERRKTMFEEMVVEEIVMVSEEWTVIGLSEGITDDELDAVIDEILGM